MEVKYNSSFEWIDNFSTFLTDLRKNQKNQDASWEFCVWAVYDGSSSGLNPMWFQDSISTILYLHSKHKDIMCLIVRTKDKHIYLISGYSEEMIVKRLLEEYSSWRSEICEELQELPKEKSSKDNKALRIDIDGTPPRRLTLIPEQIYINTQTGDKVEFGYMGATGKAICYEPGESGGGMQSSFAIKPEFLIEVKV